MLRRRARRVLAKVRRELHEALRETHTPRQVAASFALGIFITALPTLGTGVLLFFLIAYLFSNVSRIALFASVIVLNPVVKWGVYGASFWLGSEILGPVSGVSVNEVSLSAGPQIVARLLVGNLILAVVFTAVAYVVGYRLTVEYRRRAGEVGVLERYFERFVERLPGEADGEVVAADVDVATPEDEAGADADAADGEPAATDGGRTSDRAAGPDRD
jgi:uncharacterized protein (DUF2062 family)